MHPWPVDGRNPMWLDSTHVVLTQPHLDDSPGENAVCDMATNRCELATDALRTGVWRANPAWSLR